MKVNRPEIISLVDKIMKQGQVRGKEKSPAAPSVSRGDRVELSSDSEILKKILGRLEETEPSRAARLAELARLIESGAYEVDAGELAEAILRAMEEGRTP